MNSVLFRRWLLQIFRIVAGVSDYAHKSAEGHLLAAFHLDSALRRLLFPLQYQHPLPVARRNGLVLKGAATDPRPGGISAFGVTQFETAVDESGAVE